jgi:hypothetical protein
VSQPIDSANRLVAATETVRPDAPFALAVAIPPLARGGYTAIWRVRSAEVATSPRGRCRSALV